MEEKRIEDIVEIIDDDNEEVENKTTYVSPLKGKQRNRIDPEKIDRARSMYITTDLSINSIADQLGLNKYSLQKFCQDEKWSLLKQNPQFEDWSLEVVNEIYDKLDFYNDTQKLLHRMLLDEMYQTPKDVKMLVEAYKTADERTTALRLLKENANRQNGTDY